MSIDPSQLRFNHHTTYYNSFFLLRIPIIVNGQPAELSSSPQGELTLNCRSPNVGITFNSLFNEVDILVKKYGLDGISNGWCEDVPLFQLKFSSSDGLRRFINSTERLQNDLATRISSRLSRKLVVSCEASPSPVPLPVTSHTEILLLKPDPSVKDAWIVEVTPDSLSTCITLWQESEVFNFGALFRAHRTDRGMINHEVTLKRLLEELVEVVDWFHLGIFLEVPETTLTIIKHDHSDTVGCKTEMLSTWLRMTPEPTWGKLVHALIAINRKKLAYKLSLKYRVPLPSATVMYSPRTLPTLKEKNTPIQRNLIAAVEKLMGEAQTKDAELTENSIKLEQMRASRAQARERFSEVKQNALQVQRKVTSVIREKLKLQKELELKERELKVLRMVTQRSEEVTSIVDHKDREISQLQGSLHAVKRELEDERKHVRDLHKELQVAVKELAERSAQVQELERTRSMLVTYLDRERRRVDEYFAQLVTTSSRQMYTREVEHQLSAARKECESKAKEIEGYKAIISQKDEVVKRILHQLQSCESQIQTPKSSYDSSSSTPNILSSNEDEEFFQATNAVTELRMELVQIEEEKQEVVRRLEAAQLVKKLQQEVIAELNARTKTPNEPLHVEPSLLSPQTRIIWKKHADLPVSMTHPHVVRIKDDIYFGGGYCGDITKARQVFKYSAGLSTWSPLPICPIRFFALAVLDNKLVVIGGCTCDSESDDGTNTPTNSVYVLEESQRWIKSIPQLPTARFNTTAFTYKSSLIVCGGVTSWIVKQQGIHHFTIMHTTRTTAVEIFRSETSQWHKAEPLPFALSHMSPTIINDTCYLIGGAVSSGMTRRVICAFLPSLIQCALPHTPTDFPTNPTCVSFPSPHGSHSPTTSLSSSVWKVLPDCPLYGSTAAELGGCLLAIGGKDATTSFASVHFFSPSSNSWMKLTNADLPNPQLRGAATKLVGGETILVGGESKAYDFLNTAFILQ